MFPPFLWPIVILIAVGVFLVLTRAFKKVMKKRRLGQDLVDADPEQVEQDLQSIRAAAKRAAPGAEKQAEDARRRADALKRAAQE